MNLFKIKSFGLPNEPYCRVARKDGFCKQMVETSQDVETLQTGNEYQMMAEGIF